MMMMMMMMMMMCDFSGALLHALYCSCELRLLAFFSLIDIAYHCCRTNCYRSKGVFLVVRRLVLLEVVLLSSSHRSRTFF